MKYYQYWLIIMPSSASAYKLIEILQYKNRFKIWLRQLFWVNTNSYLIDLNNRAKTQPIIILIIHTNKQITISWSNHLSRCNNLTPTLYSQLSLLLMVSASCSTPHPTSNTSCRSSRLLKTTRKTKCTYSLTQVPSFRWVLLYQLFAHRRG